MIAGNRPSPKSGFGESFQPSPDLDLASTYRVRKPEGIMLLVCGISNEKSAEMKKFRQDSPDRLDYSQLTSMGTLKVSRVERTR